MKSKKKNIRQLKRFRPSSLSISVRDKHLVVQIHSPLLKAKNHTVRLFKNKLRISITGHPSYDHELATPLEYDLLIPKKGYRSIVKESFCDGLLTLKLVQFPDANAGRFIAAIPVDGPVLDCA